MDFPMFQIFSDGASFNNGKKDPSLPEFASIGIVITLNEKVIYRGCKGLDDSTISVAELTAAILVQRKLREKIEGLKSKVAKPYQIELYSDSQYVVKGVNEWLANWMKNGWKNYSGAVVAQLDLWKTLKKEFLDDPDWDVQFEHVKGHTNGEDFLSRMNQLCDDLAFWKLMQMKEDKEIPLSKKEEKRLREVKAKWQMK